MALVVAILSGFAVALAAPWLQRIGHSRVGWLMALLPLGLTIYFASFIESIAAGEAFIVTLAWVPSLGVNLSFHVDGLSLLFALLISGIGALIMIYGGGYLAGHQDIGRFYMYIMAFMASMLGLVLADNIITLFVFWELTSLTSYFLIGFDSRRVEARMAALQALLITGGGGLALLAGLVLLGLTGGSFELSTLLAQGEVVRAHALYVPILLLVLAGAFTKSAQVPFHFWLPGAMEAPTPVSAYLHSATMVKAGVYLVARMSPVLGGTEAWFAIVTVVGGATMLVGGFLALTQTDLKRILAYSTVSALGTLMLMLGLGTGHAITGAMVFLLAHALYKGAFFMLAGALDHETGTRDIERLRGLRRAMPITTVVAGVAAVSMAGLGPVFSFIGKELIFETVMETQRGRFVLAPVIVLASAIFVTVALIAGVRPFYGPLSSMPKKAHEAPPSLWLGPALLAALGLVLGVFPGLVSSALIAPSVASVFGQVEPVKLVLWHGFTPALALSGVSLVTGFGLYAGGARLRRTTSRLEVVLAWGPARWYGLFLDGINALARGQTQVLQHGYLRLYLLAVIVTTVGLVGITLFNRVQLTPLTHWPNMRFYEVAIAGLILVAALVAVRSRSRLTAVAALGVVGYGIALIFLIFGAPDLAMTQILIETLLVILFVLVLYHLPRYADLSNRITRLRDMFVALAAGGLMTLLVLTVTNTPTVSRLTPYFAEQSRPMAHGRNIVNVILVDFRALDTLGEITVLALAGMGVYALLKLRLGKREDL